MGLETVRQLAKTGAHVFFTARNEEKAEKVLADLIDQMRMDGGGEADKIEWVKMDNCSLRSVKEGAEEFLRRCDGLNVLICNAGKRVTPCLRIQTTKASRHISNPLPPHRRRLRRTIRRQPPRPLLPLPLPQVNPPPLLNSRLQQPPRRRSKRSPPILHRPTRELRPRHPAKGVPPPLVRVSWQPDPQPNDPLRLQQNSPDLVRQRSRTPLRLAGPSRTFAPPWRCCNSRVWDIGSESA